MKGMSQILKSRSQQQSIHSTRYKITQLGLFLLALVSLFVVVDPLYAQSPSITAEVDRNRISINEQVILSIVITGEASTPPALPSLDFEIIGTSRGSQISIVNGNMTTQSTHSFTLQPKRTGNLNIDSIEVEIDGQSYKSAPIMIRVGRIQGQNQGSASAQPTPEPDDADTNAPTTLEEQDFFIEAEVDNLSPYIGQQIVYTFRFYQAADLLGQPHYEAPDFTGLWNQHDTEQDAYQTQVADRTYLITELKTILFPTVVGERTISPALLTLPGNVFNRGQTLGTDSIVLDVQPLPQPEPDDFSGAVGIFDISATMNPTEVEVDEPVTLKVVIEGFGNAEAIPQPELPELDEWRVFEPTSNTSSEPLDDSLYARREDEQLWLPSQGGSYTVPAISYTFFNPDTETYETATTDPIVVNVVGEAPQPAPTAELVRDNTASSASNSSSNGSYPEPDAIAPLEVDIRPLKAVPATLTPARPDLISRLNYRVAWVMPLLLFAAYMIWGWQRDKLLSNPSLIRRSKAHKNARSILKRAQKEKGINLYIAIDKAITGYLNDKLDQPIQGLTHKMLVSLLQEKGLDITLADRVTQILSESEQARFAPQELTAEPTQALVKRAEKLLADLEQGL